tara:strand:+ start:10734 stop:10955 length:222 start_codon:yes stop_codon:yes gene_type:complete
MNSEESSNAVTSYYKGMEVKVVWKEDGKTKLGRGHIMNDDEQFIYLKGEKGLLVVNRKEIVVIKGSENKAPTR